MDEVECYVGKELERMLNLEGISSVIEYNKKTNTFIYHLENFKWVGYSSFIDIIVRKLIHNGFNREYINVTYEKGKENIHNLELLLQLTLLVDLDVMAGYLRITKDKRNA